MLHKTISIAILVCIPLTVIADRFPSEDELDGIMKGCGMGISKRVQAQVSAAVKSWRNAAINGKSSYSELGAILSESPDGTVSPEIYRTYTSCISTLVKEFNSAYQDGRAERDKISSCKASLKCDRQAHDKMKGCTEIRQEQAKRYGLKGVEEAEFMMTCFTTFDRQAKSCYGVTRPSEITLARTKCEEITQSDMSDY